MPWRSQTLFIIKWIPQKNKLKQTSLRKKEFL